MDEAVTSDILTMARCGERQIRLGRQESKVDPVKFVRPMILTFSLQPWTEIASRSSQLIRDFGPAGEMLEQMLWGTWGSGGWKRGSRLIRGNDVNGHDGRLTGDEFTSNGSSM